MSSHPDTVNPPSIHQSVGYWVSLLSRTMEAEFSRRLAPHGLTRMSYAVLGAMVFDLKTTPSGIADFLGLDRGAVTRLLDKLEAQDLIFRERGEKDRRSISVEVTATGKTLAEQLQAHSLAVNDQFTAALKPNETETLVELVKAMLAKADARPESL
jgi:DNA-binding MarR family transcriptional regulator